MLTVRHRNMVAGHQREVQEYRAINYGAPLNVFGSSRLQQLQNIAHTLCDISAIVCATSPTHPRARTHRVRTRRTRNLASS